MTKILHIDNDKPFTNADFKQVNKLLKDTEFIAKRKSKHRFAVYCIRENILSTEGMADYVYSVLGGNFKPANQ